MKLSTSFFVCYKEIRLRCDVIIEVPCLPPIECEIFLDGIYQHPFEIGELTLGTARCLGLTRIDKTLKSDEYVFQVFLQTTYEEDQQNGDLLIEKTEVYGKITGIVDEFRLMFNDFYPNNGRIEDG